MKPTNSTCIFQLGGRSVMYCWLDLADPTVHLLLLLWMLCMLP